jgi:hypothetical protein
MGEPKTVKREPIKPPVKLLALDRIWLLSLANSLGAVIKIKGEKYHVK